MRGKKVAVYVVGAMFTTLLGWSSAGPAFATGEEYAGRATALRVTASGAPVSFADTGELPSSGGNLDSSEQTAGVPDVASAETLHASTIGIGDFTHSEASIGGVTITAGTYTVTADLVMSRANADNQGGWVILGGHAHVDGLLLNGLPVVVTGEPNQTIPLAGGQLVINEQSSSTSGAIKSISVTALHLSADGVNAEAGTSKAGLTEAAQTCSPTADFATGGGWIVPPGQTLKATFGFVGGVKNGVVHGHLVFKDRQLNDRVKGEVTIYTPAAGIQRTMVGTDAEVNGDPGTFELRVSDIAEPGANSDTFSLDYASDTGAGSVSGTLGGGNIQLHPGC
jgi:hypothetical protein